MISINTCQCTFWDVFFFNEEDRWELLLNKFFRAFLNLVSDWYCPAEGEGMNIGTKRLWDHCHWPFSDNMINSILNIQNQWKLMRERERWMGVLMNVHVYRMSWTLFACLFPNYMSPNRIKFRKLNLNTAIKPCLLWIVGVLSKDR